jgi:tRNA modification GTPase
MACPADTIAALATPTGTSALAIVRASGPAASALVAALFRQPPAPREVRRGDYRDMSGRLIDDVLYAFFQGPNSYTGEDSLEITCHGNPFIISSILSDLFVRGCRPAEPGEFTRRAFLNGRMDLSQAEAVADLIHARSERALAAAHQQLQGALGRRLRDLTDRLVSLLAHVEAYVDFPDEDLPPEDRAAWQASVADLRAATARLLATGPYGALLRHGVKTVILGAPNTGKSSLLNRLVGRERALVSPEPGTTRDYLEETVTLGAHCIRLSDTAGLNPRPGPVEHLGIAKTLECAAEADLILWVLDASRAPFPPLPEEIRARCSPRTAIAVINKCDLVPDGSHPTLPGALPAVRTSALTGDGIEELVAAVVRFVESFRVEQGEDVIAINARHAHALKQATACLEAASTKVAVGGPIELLASDLRGALACFGEISGKIDNERVLDRLFSTFCIGK